MPKSRTPIPAVAALVLVAALSACGGGRSDEVVYVDEPAITVEPAYTGKYK